MPGMSSKMPSLKFIEHPDGLSDGIEVDNSITDGEVLGSINCPSSVTPVGFGREESRGFDQVAVREYLIDRPKPFRVQVVDGDARGGVFSVLVSGADELPLL